MSRNFREPEVPLGTSVRPISMGGTGVADLNLLPAALDIVSQEELDAPNGVAMFKNGKIQEKNIPSSLSAGASFDTLVIKKHMFFTGGLGILRISNFSSDRTYNVSCQEAEIFHINRNTGSAFSLQINDSTNNELEFVRRNLTNIDLSIWQRFSFLIKEIGAIDSTLRLIDNAFDGSYIIVICPETPCDLHIQINERSLTIPVVPRTVQTPTISGIANNSVVKAPGAGTNGGNPSLTLTCTELVSSDPTEELRWLVWELSDQSDFSTDLLSSPYNDANYNRLEIGQLVENRVHYVRCKIIGSKTSSAWSETLSFVTEP